ncbi:MULTISPECIES: lamin tail domain-containing protein [Streptomyces]|uniref:Lamin Tail Domain n=2 Tax=Streptomyces TaxID=1883 RepID=A0A1I6RGN1_9ACTN|nr:MULTISPECIES: lamin tail domain-containing protein [Streptomyces]QKV68701.1 lamin tail domain-containing protein [Streptomyces harbinensis]SFS63893.1 Lamin Tail Domain [Streptomyces harbinensis]
MTRSRLTALLATCVVALLLPLGTAGGAQAAGAVKISKIHYNSPGKDDRSNASLNGEWVRITNSTTKAVSLKGWTLTDAQKHTYTFGTFTLGSGKSVTVRTGSGKNTASNVYQNRRAYVWNNDKDTATLRKANGTKVHSCSYNNPKVEFKNC